MGIHNRTQDPPEESVSDLRKLLKIIKTKFRNAKVWVPVINFSKTLARKQQETLCTINQFIVENCFSKRHFSVEKDKILWSSTTAQCLFDQWSKVFS